MRSIVLAAVLALMGFAAHAQPIGVDVATISMSAPGVPRTVTNTVCASDGTDLVCDRGVYLSPSGRVGVGVAAPSASIHLVGSTDSDGIILSNPNEPQYWMMGKRPGSYITGPAPHLLYYAFFNGSGWIQPLNLHSEGMVGIRRSAPSTTLDVLGSLKLWQEVSATLGVCDANRTGAIRFTGGDFSFCRNGSAWETLTSLGGGGGLGDRIVSGTTAATVNSATTYISLTTGSTTWGYISSGTSYLPRVHTAQVSATMISATAVQIFSPTTALACSADLAGTIRYNSPTTTLELCTGSGWQPMGVGIPAGTISAFASTTCPVGWSEYTAARGRFLRGIDNGAGNDPSGTRAPGAVQADDLKSHTHPIYRRAWYANELIGGGTFFTPTGTSDNANVLMNTNATGGAETRPKNIAVTFCQFNGTSNGWNNPLSGGSTVAAGSTGQVQYNTAGSFDASPDFSWANGSKVLGVGGTVSSSKVATNDVKLSDVGGSCSASDDLGRMFRNATTGRLQLCLPR